MRRAMEAGSPGMSVWISNKFHQAIASSVGNPILSDILTLWGCLEDVTAIVMANRVDDSYYEYQESWRQSRRECRT